jgi:hypothetical protein
MTLSAGSITVGEDNSGNYFPFGFPVVGPGTQYQEAYSSSLFSGPITITAIDFFVQPNPIDIVNTLYTATFSLSLSTITADVNSLSNTDLNSNLGADNTSFTTVNLSGLAPNELTFTGAPFLYNPADGNLLLNIDITNVITTGTAAFQDNGPDGPSTIARYQNFGTGTSGYGLVTEFDFTPQVPEPGSFGLLAAGLGSMVLLRNRLVRGTNRSGYGRMPSVFSRIR